LKDENIFCIEADPFSYKKIIEEYSFKTFNLAFTNNNGLIKFNALMNEHYKGISSIAKRVDNFLNSDYVEVEVEGKRADSFCQDQNLKLIDVCKVDVEGHTYEVLEGFGNAINNIKIFHLEHEHQAVWVGEKLYPEIKFFMKNKNFTEIFKFKPKNSLQSESVWINNTLLNH
jgi:FkbM family methyltransferase